MNVTRRALLGLGGSALLATLAPLANRANAQGIAEASLKALVPDEQDLQGFVRIRPAEEVLPLSLEPLPVAKPLSDDVRLNANVTNPEKTHIGTVSSIARSLYSVDGSYWISMQVSICDSPDTARNEVEYVRRRSSAGWTQGTFGGSEQVGQESWVLGGDVHGASLLSRYGRMVIDVKGGLSSRASKNSANVPLPTSVAEVIARMILLRGAWSEPLVGITARKPMLVVNGKLLPTDATLAIGGVVYVSIARFAEPAGLQYRWNAENGSLTLSSPKQQPISRAVGIALAKEGTPPIVVMSPLLKVANQPVMVLQDLLLLVNGQIISQQSDTYDVTV